MSRYASRVCLVRRLLEILPEWLLAWTRPYGACTVDRCPPPTRTSLLRPLEVDDVGGGSNSTKTKCLFNEKISFGWFYQKKIGQTSESKQSNEKNCAKTSGVLRLFQEGNASQDCRIKYTDTNQPPRMLSPPPVSAMPPTPHRMGGRVLWQGFQPPGGLSLLGRDLHPNRLPSRAAWVQGVGRMK